MHKRVVITGIGLISSIGIGKDQFWNAAVNGKSGVGPITSFDTSAFKVNIGAEVKGFKANDFVDDNFCRRLGMQAQFGVAGTRLALDDAGLEPGCIDPSRIGVVIGALFGEPTLFEKTIVAGAFHGLDSIDTENLYAYPYASPCQCISSHYGFKGPSETLYCACSSGNAAIARACTMIEQDMVDVVVAGGVDTINIGIFANFDGLRSLAREACQPFDKNREGIVIGEGAGIVLVQSLESAQAMRSPIVAEIYGFGQTCDAYHASSPDPHSKGLRDAMQIALKEASIDKCAIDYISAHGTGTRMNDKVETLALKKTFGKQSDKLLVSSVKSMIGHSMGASSAIEAIVCCLAIRDNIALPTINYIEKDPECDLNYVPNIAMDHPISVCMNNSLAFGGINISMIIGECR